MDLQLLFLQLLFFVVGVVLIIVGVRFRLGHIRASFVFWTTKTSAIYAFIPFGASLILLGVGIGGCCRYPDKSNTWLMTLMSILVTTGVIFSLSMPKFLTPRWLQILLKNHNDIILLLMNEAAKDYSGWQEQTKTDEELEMWAREARQKILGGDQHKIKMKQP